MNLLGSFQSKGYAYRGVRWRHVGCSNDADGDLVFTMLDLGSLVSPADASTKKQMEELIKCSERPIDEQEVKNLLDRIS